MLKKQLLEARELINQKKYQEARRILHQIDDPVARKWLLKLDELDPPTSRRLNIGYIIGLLAAFAVGVIIGGILFGNKTSAESNLTAAALPTQVALPSIEATDISPTFTDTPTITSSPSPAATSTPSQTPSLTFTPTVTSTQTPSNTPIPTHTLTPTVPPQSQQIGPIYDDVYDETFSVQVDLLSVEFSPGEGFDKPSSGKEYMIAQVNVHNLGPGTLRDIGSTSFQVKDANGAIRDSTFISFKDCSFDFVDLTASGSTLGCIAFEVPRSGSLQLIYAPFQYEGLQPGRYISFEVR